MTDSSHDTPGVITYPPLIYAAGLVIGYVLHRLWPMAWLPRGPHWIAGLVLIALGMIPAFGALAVMYRARTSVDPHRPTTALVTHGPFRYTRNPIYLAFTVVYLGAAALANGLMLLVPLPVVIAVMQRGVIEREERYLERKFGDSYRQYESRVRRWI
jgi:protein-S-isoprenylcysteine O-methyltransferase Ste14